MRKSEERSEWKMEAFITTKIEVQKTEVKPGLTICVVCSGLIWREHYRKLAEKSLDRYVHVDAAERMEGVLPDKIIFHRTNISEPLWRTAMRVAQRTGAKIYEERYI